MILLAPLLQNFFADRLIAQRRCSQNTIASYRDTFRLFLEFTQRKIKKDPCSIELKNIDATLVGEFLENLESNRKNSIRTRNTRLAAIHSFFRYLAIQEPAYLGQIQQVLAIPQKRFEKNIVKFLNQSEVDALLSAPNRNTWLGKRDHALLLLAVQTGLRVSEITGLRCQDVVLNAHGHVRCHGKGRKERCTPLTRHTVEVLRAWLRERNGSPTEPLFPTIRGDSLSRDTVEYLVKKYSTIASQTVASLKNKSISPHILRHTAAVRLLQVGVDRSVIALWLGHEQVETTQIYLHADLAIKERALARTATLTALKIPRYKPDDSLLSFLNGL